jgi:NADPH2:quinone reductase
MVVASPMRSLQVSELAEDFAGCSIVTQPIRTPNPGDVLVRVRGAALGFPALLMTRGAYQHKPDLPFVFGGDLAGEVVGLGEGVTNIELGARVATGALTGAFAEYCTVPAAGLTLIPTHASFAQAAAFPSAYLTAHVSLVHAGQVQAGEWVLVLGAAGGVGLAAVDLATRLRAHVIAAASSAEKRAKIAQAFPNAHVIDSSAPFRDAVRDLSGGGVNVVYDPVGGDAFDQSLSCLAFAGRLLVVGFASGRIPTLPVNRALIKNLSILGVRAGEYSRRFPEKRRESWNFLSQAWSENGLRPYVDSEWALDDWRQAVERVVSRGCVGRVIVRP